VLWHGQHDFVGVVVGSARVLRNNVVTMEH
jgi:hypothetical protein